MSTDTGSTTSPIENGLRPINGVAWRGSCDGVTYEVTATDEGDGIAVKCQIKYGDDPDWQDLDDHNWPDLMDLFVVENYDALRKATNP